MVGSTVDKQVRAARGRRSTARTSHVPRLWIAAFVAPALVTIVTMRVTPAVGAIASSLQSAYPGGLRPAQWVGMKNYAALAADPLFWQMVQQTLVFNLVINPLQVLLALGLAVLLTRRIAGRSLWRVLVFVPATIPIVGSSITWSVALQPQGPVNSVIAMLGGSPQPFLTSPSQALWSVIFIATWIGIGYWMIFLIAGLEDIPTEYLEAAMIDRAGPVRTFFSVTLPLLRRQILFVLVADTVANFVLFVPIQLLTNGGPQDSTTMLMFDAYRTTYDYGSAQAGAARVVILTAIMLVVVIVQFLLLRDRDEASA